MLNASLKSTLSVIVYKNRIVFWYKNSFYKGAIYQNYKVISAIIYSVK